MALTGTAPHLLLRDTKSPAKTRKVALDGVHGFIDLYSASPDGSSFAIIIGAGDGVSGSKTNIWFDSNGKKLGSITLDEWGQSGALSRSQMHQVSAMGYLPDSKKLVTLGDALTAWDLSTGKQIWTARAPDRGGTGQYLTVSDHYAAVAGFGDNVSIFDVKTGELVKSIGFKAIEALQLLPSNKLVLVSLRTPCQGKVYDLNTGSSEDFNINLPTEKLQP